VKRRKKKREKNKPPKGDYLSLRYQGGDEMEQWTGNGGIREKRKKEKGRQAMSHFWALGILGLATCSQGLGHTAKYRGTTCKKVLLCNYYYNCS
jgi:hypothetical protein